MSTSSTWLVYQCLEGARAALEAAAQMPQEQWSGAGRGIYDARVEDLRGLLTSVEEAMDQAEADIAQYRVAVVSVGLALGGGTDG
ncbi:hypothetical protein [Buchananella felis]|uniref:hypothetical protein n=1 Tax=Buchananella felis TaxID=3231492 RepID=UPI003527104D